MKAFILSLIAIFAISANVIAQKPETITLHAGQSRTAAHSKLKVKFVSVLEDSRCPKDAQCIWAGNAKVRIQVTSPRLGTKTFDINTTTGPQGDQFDGWAIYLDSLSPERTSSRKVSNRNYRITLTIQRLTR